jgi:DNA-binding Xre family transcriptional regulator
LTSNNTSDKIFLRYFCRIINQSSSGGTSVTVSCHLRILLAKVNVERARQGKPTLSLRRLAAESGVSLSVLAALNTGRNQRIDYATLDRLLNYFNCYFSVTINDLLIWERTPEGEAAISLDYGIRA